MQITVQDIQAKKKKNEKIVALTAYDYSFAKLVDDAGVDIILVGDSVGTVCLGYDSTRPVTMDDMLHHTKAVSRAVKRALLIADMPFGSYQSDAKKAISNANRFLEEAGAQAVKVEGAGDTVKIVEKMVQAGIAVMGHVGLTPQTAEELGGYKVQGKTHAGAKKIFEDAIELQCAGVFSLVLECVPLQLARLITEKISVPTIGIGAGGFCDGQILVLNDLLGIERRLHPKFVRRYAEFAAIAEKALASFKKDVLNGSYPSTNESYTMDKSQLPEAQ